MKKRLATAAFLMICGLALLSQTPPPPPNDPSNGGSNGPVGGGAPIGEGIAVLALLGLAYTAKKVFHLTKKDNVK